MPTPSPPRRKASPSRLGAPLALLLALHASVAEAQPTTGRVAGRIVDEATGAALGGLTVIAHGPQGDESTLTDERGEYALSSLPVGTYVLRIYAADAKVPVERPGILVSADQAVRVNVRLPRAAQAGESIVLTVRAPTLDLGTARTGLTLRREDLTNAPVGSTFGEALEQAPGAFVDRSGSVSIAGASGLENVYVVDGLNVTGLELGDIMNLRPNASGGTNLPIEFVEELSISSGGYAAEHGGAMGGVVNVVTKSGSNQLHGTAFSSMSPAWLQGEAATVGRTGSALVGRARPGLEWELGGEVGGPIIANRLFFWAAFAPRRQTSVYQRDVLAQVDANQDGVSDVGPDGALALNRVLRSETDQSRLSLPFALKLTFLPRPEHRLSLALIGTPTSSRQVFDHSGGDAEAAAGTRWAQQAVSKRNTDLVASWTGDLLPRRWKMEATLGLHDERFSDRSPFGDLNQVNQVEWHGASLFDLEAVAGCKPELRGTQLWDPCPVDVYHTGGYGAVRSYGAQRWMAELKSTHLFSLYGVHELKFGARLDLAVLDQTRSFSGPLGNRALVQHFPGNTSVWSFFSLPPGRYPFQYADGAPGDLDPDHNGSPADLALAPAYQDALKARVKNVSPALFIQDAYSIRPNLLVNLGARLENQRLYDSQGAPFADFSNLAFRGGFVYDPTNEGRARISGHYGRFFEAVPLNLGARYFGGEGILIRNYDNTACATPPAQWAGKGEWSGCPLQPQNPPGSTPYGFYNNGSNYPVQPHLEGQYHDEVVGGAQVQLLSGTVLGLEYTHRWLGAVIEDGTAADGTFVLANPGRVPQDALKATQAEIDAKQKQLDAAPAADKAALANDLGALQSKLANLEGLAAEPKPERTYQAITASVSQRIAQHFSARAWYTYSRLYGNYNGLYDADNNYAAPNGNNAYDTPDLVLNKRGPLANDRPHSFRAAGYYERAIGDGALVAGLSFAAFSGVPRNYQSALIPGQQLIFLLPRGAAGRTPAITQLDARLSYRHKVAKDTSVELYVELFNLMNRRTPLRLDDNYTFDMAAAIVNGTKGDLPYAKNIGGAPVTVNPNFGKPTAFQAPFHGRLGLRALF